MIRYPAFSVWFCVHGEFSLGPLEQGFQGALDFRIFKDLDIPEMSIAAGQLVLAEGSTGAAMYIIRSGSVAVRLNGATIEEIGEGGIFGEMAIIEQSTRSAEILALTDVTVVMLDEKKFLQLVAKVPHFSVMVMRTLARRIRKMNARS
ncbi:MAG TPA: Crp/Fnr family transcriptional regulator [Aestuariivirga sp.]|nr:Crp/Fnr family transcriptional regulator [Aestuariivirga sp.]